MEPAMSIPSRLSSYLQQRGANYEVCAHDLSHSSAESARAAHVPAGQLAKSVVLEDDLGYVVAVIPSDKSVMLRELGDMLGRKQLRLCEESRVASLFADCDRGAVPAAAMAWGLETVVDDDCEANDVIYMEGGDHERLLRMSREQFHALMSNVRHGHFSKSQMH
jgi:Ala-tRNA(Pro) deacylase